MTRFVFRTVIHKIRIAAACAMASACVLAIPALAQHVGHPVGGGHVGGAVHVPAPHVVPPHVFVPPASRTLISRPPVVRGPIPIGESAPGFGFRRHRFPIFPGPFFFRAPFFGFRENFDSLWWLNCGPLWGWEYGCNDLFLYPYAFETSVIPPLRYEYPVYFYSGYGGADHDLVHLYLQDGTVIGVTDYWFVNDQIHFTVPDEEGEQVIDLDELDLQKTINVNTRRGFRFVKRDEPMEQYLLHHPNPDPPLVPLPPKNEARQKN